MSHEACIATWELTKKDVTAPEKFLLLSFARRAGEDHTCWPSLKRIEEDTGLDRKTIVAHRQKLLEKGLLEYTGEMKGRTGQVPVMKLRYVLAWEQNRNSPRLKDNDMPVDNPAVDKINSPNYGTGNSPKNGPGTSPKNGTLNMKEEYVKRNSVSASPFEKPKAPLADVTKQSTSFKRFDPNAPLAKASTILEEFMSKQRGVQVAATG